MLDWAQNRLLLAISNQVIDRYLSGQWTHRSLVVSRQRARACFGDLQFVTILRVDDLRAHPRIHHPCRRLEEQLLVHGPAGPRFCLDLGQVDLRG